jgi:hypothetical protein
VTCDCGGGTMRTFTAACGTSGCIDGLRCATVCALDASMCVDTPASWPTATGGVLTSQSYAYTVALRFVAGGDLVGVGYFGTDVTVGGSTLTASSGPNAFVFRLGSNGTSRWAHSLGASTMPGDLRIASNGDLVIGAWLGGLAMDLGNNVTLPASSDHEVAIIRYNPLGVAQSATVVAHGFGVSQVVSLALAPDDRAVVVDQASGTVTAGSQTLTGTSEWGTVVVATDTSGAVQWGKLYTSAQGVIPQSVARTSSGDVVAAVEAFSASDFGSGPLTGAVLVRVAADGTLRFATTAAPAGLVVATGDDVVAIGGNASGSDVIVARVDPTGAMKWQTPLHANLSGSLFAALTVDATGAPTFILRMFHVQIEGHDFFGDVSGDKLLAQLDASGHYVRGRAFGGPTGGATLSTIELASDGTTAFGGYFYDPHGTVDFGAGQWVAPPQPTPNTYVTEGFYVLMQP